MPLEVQCCAVVIRNDALERVLEGGAEAFGDIAPNAMSYSDNMLSQASFMAQVDADEFIRSLELRGLSRDSTPPDFVVVQAQKREVQPPCDWLLMFEYEGRLAVTMTGNDSTTLYAPKHAGSELKHYTEEEIRRDFEFVERKNNIDTYRNKNTGELVYSARRTETPEEIFQRVFERVWTHRRAPGRPAATGRALQELEEDIAELQSLVAKHPELSRPRLAIGIAWNAAGNSQNAKRQLEQAAQLEPDLVTIHQELGSVYLELRDHVSAAAACQRAVSIEPDNTGLLGNLALSQLLAGSTRKAEKTIAHALRLDPDDRVNQNVANMVRQVQSEQRPTPTSLEELMGSPTMGARNSGAPTSSATRRKATQRRQWWLVRTFQKFIGRNRGRQP
ncbi:MAG TPA: hypothetical protein DDW52_13330 [Planctomycetaceae bacterium]|nr:hypothetical protein [Planctomycetaceae bacterium]